jgi:hypothetical protein
MRVHGEILAIERAQRDRKHVRREIMPTASGLSIYSGGLIP